VLIGVKKSRNYFVLKLVTARDGDHSLLTPERFFLTSMNKTHSMNRSTHSAVFSFGFEHMDIRR